MQKHVLKSYIVSLKFVSYYYYHKVMETFVNLVL